MSVLGLPWSEREVFSITPAKLLPQPWSAAFVCGLLIGASFLFPGVGLFGASAFGAFGGHQ